MDIARLRTNRRWHTSRYLHVHNGANLQHLTEILPMATIRLWETSVRPPRRDHPSSGEFEAATHRQSTSLGHSLHDSRNNEGVHRQYSFFRF